MINPICVLIVGMWASDVACPTRVVVWRGLRAVHGQRPIFCQLTHPRSLSRFLCSLVVASWALLVRLPFRHCTGGRFLLRVALRGLRRISAMSAQCV